MAVNSVAVGTAIDRPPPRDQLDPKAKTLWRVGNVLGGVLPLFIFVGIVAFFPLWLLLDFSVWIAMVPAVAILVIGLPLAWLLPSLTYRYWRYEVKDTEVDLQHGYLVRTRTLVPMARIQHVDTRRGPFERWLGLASVVLYTAAGANEIPALSRAIAEQVRDRIASIANTYEDL